jgi:tetratricopeptide (TPR) repeat protein
MDKQLPSNNRLKGAAIVLMLLTLSITGFAQTRLTLKDAKEINYQATETVKQIPPLLNLVTDPTMLSSDLLQMEGDSYKASRNQIFYNKDVTVEDDIDPSANLGASKDRSVEKYLAALDVEYDKTTDATITYKNLVSSSIKKKDYIYVNVKFDADFSGHYRAKSTTPYKTRQRVAIVRMSTSGNGKWQALIVGVNFYNPANPIDGLDNNTDIYTDTSATATVVPPDMVFKESDSFRTSKEEEEKAIQANFDEYITNGNNYFTDKRFNDAFGMYTNAQKLKAFTPALDRKIMDTKRMMAIYTFDNFKNKGDKAKDERRYKEAIQFYQQAAILKPEANSIIVTAIAPLTKMLSLVAPADNKVAAGQLEEAMDECDRILRENKKTKTEYPELYFIKGKACEAMIAKKPDESKWVDKALENYGLAIQYFPNYLDARLARAAFYIKYKNDFSSAISDYDVLTLNAEEESPEKPIYLATKAHWKDKVANYTDALADYTKAISLSPKNAVYYYDKGELLYRTAKNDEAQLNLDAAIKLNPKYEAAFYIRALNYFAIKNYSAAGVDFAEAEKIGFEPAHFAKRDSISNAFFLAAEELRKNVDFANANIQYDNALKINKCNSNALHGKGEVLFTMAEGFNEKDMAAKSKYLQSIDQNKQAIVCAPDFSDAHFKLGLANNRLGNYESAVKAYGEAIRSDKTNWKAYIEQGNTYQIQEKYAKAVEDFSQAINIIKAFQEQAKSASKSELAKSLTLELSNAEELYGEALYNSKDYDNALLALDQALNFNEFNAEALYYRGLVHVQQADFSKAYKDNFAAIKITPKHKYFYANGNASLTNKNYEQAISSYNDAITADTLGTVKNRFYLLGLSYFKNKDFDNAGTAFGNYEKGGVLKSDSAFNTQFGLSLLYKDQDSLAVKHLNAALASKPNDPYALHSMGCALAKKGQFEKASEYFDKAFATRLITRDEIKPAENRFLQDFFKTKPMKTKYNVAKKANTE